jgi:hypothetical protein
LCKQGFFVEKTGHKRAAHARNAQRSHPRLRASWPAARDVVLVKKRKPKLRGKAMTHHLPPELPPDDFDRLVLHLKEEEAHDQAARVSSIESLKGWLANHPALQQPSLMEAIAVYGPAFLEIVRRALGL